MKPSKQQLEEKLKYMVVGSSPFDLAMMFYAEFDKPVSYDKISSELGIKRPSIYWAIQSLREKYGFKIATLGGGLYQFSGFDDTQIKKPVRAKQLKKLGVGENVSKSGIVMPKYTELQKLALGLI